jgi:hypothetical protein
MVALLSIGFAMQYRTVHAFSSGIVGYSGNPATNSGNNCNICHGGGTAPTVTISGPTSVSPGELALYTLTISGGQEVAGGFNVSAENGIISTAGGGTQIISGEITHTAPKPVNASNDVVFQFNWTAPNTPGEFTLYGSGNSVNLSNGNQGDRATSNTLDVTVEAGQASGDIYFSLDGSGTLVGLPYGPEDVMVYNPSGPSLAMFFDGSDVGLTGANVDAVDILPNGRIILSFEQPVSGLPGFGGSVQPADLVLFIPSSTGNTTAGVFALAFDGSDVGLDGANENVDGFTLTGASRGWLSVSGDYSVTGLSGGDSDLIEFVASSVGANTSGTFALALDGPAVGLSSNSGEDVDGVWFDGPQVYLTTGGAYSVSGLSGDGNDIFVCSPTNSNPITGCAFDTNLFADASLAGVTQSIDAFTVITGAERAVSFDIGR